MKKQSDTIYAADPSEEHPYTWVEDGGGDMACFFYRTSGEAEADARANYHNFEGAMSKRKVYVVKVIEEMK